MLDRSLIGASLMPHLPVITVVTPREFSYLFTRRAGTLRARSAETVAQAAIASNPV
jgi:hypothetical protein